MKLRLRVKLTILSPRLFILVGRCSASGGDNRLPSRVTSRLCSLMSVTLVLSREEFHHGGVQVIHRANDLALPLVSNSFSRGLFARMPAIVNSTFLRATAFTKLSFFEVRSPSYRVVSTAERILSSRPVRLPS